MRKSRVTNVNDLPTGIVNITGTATQNQTLTATNTLADIDGLGTLNYQWQESSDNGVTWTNISGATNNTFALSQTQVGKTVPVTYTHLRAHETV
ncbi:MAG: hypothetical protein RLZZ203_1277, partial [Cyanobacteriota bacterium]